MNNKKPFKDVFIKTLFYMYKAAPATLIVFLICSLLYAVEQLVEILATQRLFDIVADSLSDTNYKKAVGCVIVIGVLFLFGPVLESLLNIVQGYLYRRTDGYLQSLIYQKVAKVDLIHFEQTETFDKIKMAVEGSSEVPAICRDVLLIVTNYIPFIILLLVYFYSIKPVFCVIMFAIFLPVYFSEVMRASEYYRLESGTVNLRRHSEYFADCISSREYCKETRTCGAVKFFFSLYLNYLNDYVKALWKTQKKVSRIDLLLGTVNILGYTIILAMLVYYLIKGEISIGVFSAVYYSLSKLYNMSQSLTKELGGVMKNVTLGSYLFDFLNQNFEHGKKGMPEKFRGIELRNVSFKYPGASGYSLKNINLTLHFGETIALVGENGAGKTTLTKILLGLFQPTEGSATFGGKDLSEYSMDTVFSASSAVFQTYQKYQMKLNENVLISDSASGKDVMPAIEKADITLNSNNYPNCLETMLSREFGGVDLAGGQWQRVAIARGIYRDCDFIVLDEPTAAIDPIEETKIYNKFAEVMKEKTAILVTHRLGSTKITDRIIVMKDGEIVESGTHKDLMETESHYKEMFLSQSEWYT